MLLGGSASVLETGVCVLGGGVKVTVAGGTVTELTGGEETGTASGVEDGLLA